VTLHSRLVCYDGGGERDRYFYKNMNFLVKIFETLAVALTVI
jgi:hypothetical protein